MLKEGSSEQMQKDAWLQLNIWLGLVTGKEHLERMNTAE